jgi:hypothetical protein
MAVTRKENGSGSNVTKGDGRKKERKTSFEMDGWCYKGKSKVKAVPLQAWNGPEGSRELRFPDFLTTTQDGGKVVSITHRPHLPPINIPGTHFC